MKDYPFRAHGRWAHLKRVRDRGSIIVSVGEQHGVTDRVLQVAELVSWGSRVQPLDPTVKLERGALVVFNQARVHDHLRWGSEDIIVYPGEWLLGVVDGTFLSDNPGQRDYDLQPV